MTEASNGSKFDGGLAAACASLECLDGVGFELIVSLEAGIQTNDARRFKLCERINYFCSQFLVQADQQFSVCDGVYSRIGYFYFFNGGCGREAVFQQKLKKEVVLGCFGSNVIGVCRQLKENLFFPFLVQIADPLVETRTIEGE